MKILEITVYLMLVLAILFAFVFIFASLAFVLIAFFLIGKVKKYNKKLAKKLNYVAIGILIFNIIILVLSGILVFLIINGSLGNVTIAPT